MGRGEDAVGVDHVAEIHVEIERLTRHRGEHLEPVPGGPAVAIEPVEVGREAEADRIGRTKAEGRSRKCPISLERRPAQKR